LNTGVVRVLAEVPLSDFLVSVAFDFARECFFVAVRVFKVAPVKKVANIEIFPSFQRRVGSIQKKVMMP